MLQYTVLGNGWSIKFHNMFVKVMWHTCSITHLCLCRCALIYNNIRSNMRMLLSMSDWAKMAPSFSLPG